MKCSALSIHTAISISIIGCFLPISTQGFLVSKPDVNLPVINPFLKNFANEHMEGGIKLNIRMDILEDINDVKSSHLYIKDLIVELNNKEPEDENYAKLIPPETDKLSNTPSVATVRTGPLGLQSHSKGGFVSSKGYQIAPLEHGCWEMLWLEGKPAGSVVCAFDIAEDISRNDAVLKAGTIYISFPAFTKQGLMSMRTEQDQYKTMLELQIATEREELQKIQMTKNPLKKLMHFRNAVIANDEFMRLRSIGYAAVPMNDEEFMFIGDDLMLHSKGSVWSREAAANCFFVGDASLKM